jgi:hypothetical protein
MSAADAQSDLPAAPGPRVVTWLGPEKALAIATHADGLGVGTPDGIYDVEAEELGPGERNDHGLVVVGALAAKAALRDEA